MYDDLKQKIIAASAELGIDKIGFTTAAPFTEMAASLQAQKAAGHTSGFEHQVLAERLYPDQIFDQPQSIIAIALAYPSKMQQKAPRDRKQRRGTFARASWGEDYHFILRDKMQQLAEFIEANTELEFRFKPMVDTGELSDVAVAQRAGMGFIGRNGLLVTEEFGSFVYIGEIITNIPFAPDPPVENQCGTCTRCIDYCPPQALLGDGRLNAQRCLSYQTQTKGMMAEEFRPQIRSVIYGCDICQLVCPFNRGKDAHHHARMEPEVEEVTPVLQSMLTISNKEFKQRFGRLAGSWRGKKPLQRNAIIALANVKDRSAVPLLLEVIENDPRPVIRATAIWAVAELAQHADPALQAFLHEQQITATDSEVQQALLAALTKLQSKKD
ncbi:tRNA epoxyqueuosine(34) reductase QueG [Loigolactobacillus zhaoyuanensis]|uniref:tRNA epoxyqueuosine(34) reductase QueG n=1 Tax=Loigolactobacillus zhaoyuanensis TaxID=2486017 RepID=A0ABW8U9S9_9LACO|nr:tRNA epoxyqueuosine(34) reductase QueG [Loigolactobacillus zhaoyuanensis]